MFRFLGKITLAVSGSVETRIDGYYDVFKEVENQTSETHYWNHEVIMNINKLFFLQTLCTLV